MRTAKALARLRGCAGSPELSLVAYAISTIISLAGSVTSRGAPHGSIVITPVYDVYRGYYIVFVFSLIVYVYV